ncbi:MAG: acyl-CoA dehydrogenase family protein, partial [Gemmatimonadota bacterium]
MPTLLTEPRPALTTLSEDERMFQEAVRDFAQSEIAPKVREMDEAQQMDAGIISQLFELGLMGIEIPETYGGTASDFFTSVLVVEELSKVDPSIGVLVDVQNTLFINAFLRWGNDDLRARYFPRLATDTVGAYALSEAGSGSDAFALSCRATQDGDD